MKIAYSARALSDLAAIHDFLAQEWPGVGKKFDSRLGEIEHRILTFPIGAVAVEDRQGVFVVPLINLPYRLFYALDGDAAVILQIRSTSLADWDD